MNLQEKDTLRKSKIAARNSLTLKERTQFSEEIAARIASSPEFENARTIMIYCAVRGEVNLDPLKKHAADLGKQFVFPLCISKTEMIALLPKENPGEEQSAWKKGAFGIMEPVREYSIEIAPEDIDMVICPCTAFDEQGGRMGMGAGYYDRYLAKCTKACVTAAAFEVQKTEIISMEAWDVGMDMVFTERAVYFGTSY